ncbi:hypothetical protein [Gracilimonas tropica]|uniref:hypothetical protein n=1 Tax=Gracilimonas tropica TaxID=454600 RepID=UPI0003799F15|nr:hypothetical protein [Gracilimonas tropica]
MFKKLIIPSILSVFFLALASYPSMIGTNVDAPGESFYVSPMSEGYMFSFDTYGVQAETISLRVTPLNGDPEIKTYCFYETSCTMDLSNYDFDTSSDYIIWAGATGTSGYLFFEPN